MLYVTERCVFRLDGSGLELIEVAPGIDIERDILAHMDVQADRRTTRSSMDARLFRDEPMGLDGILLERPLSRAAHAR